MKPSRLQAADQAFAVLLFLSFILYFGLSVFREVWIGDICRYIAGVSALQTSFWSPGHEAVALAPSQETAIYTPFVVGAALIGKALALSPYATLQLVGVLNLVLYVASICRFFRVFSVSKRCWSAPALFLLVSLTVRNFNYGWSSETSLVTFKWVQAYPSTFGWSIVLLCLSESELYLRTGRKAHLISLVLGTWTLFISHIISAGWLVGLLLLRLIFQRLGAQKECAGSSPAVLGVIAASLLATPLWPYFNIFDIFSQTGYPEVPKFGNNLPAEIWYPFLLGLPALLYFNLKGVHRLLTFWFLGTWGALLTFKLLGITFGMRFFFFQQFFLHVAIAEAMTLALRKLLSSKEKIEGSLLVWLILSIVGVTLSPQFTLAASGAEGLKSPSQLLQSKPSRLELEQRWGAFREAINQDDVVITPPGEVSVYLAAYTGCRSVTGLYTHLLNDSEERTAGVEAFFDPTKEWPDRIEVLQKYKVTKVVVPVEQAEHAKDIQKHLGDPLFRGDRYLVFSTVN